MIIIGSGVCDFTRQTISKALASHDEEYLTSLAKEIAYGGTNYIQIFEAAREDDKERLIWLTELVQKATEKPLCIEFSDMDQVARAMEIAQMPGILRYRSCTIKDVEAHTKVYPLLKDNDWKAMVVPMKDDGRGFTDAKGWAEKGASLIRDAEKYEIAPERIFIEACIDSIDSSRTAMLTAMEAMRIIKEQFPTVNIFGSFINRRSSLTPLPIKRALNAAAIPLAAVFGLNTVVIDPLDREIRAAVYASDALLMRDRFGRDFDKAYRNGDFAGSKCPQCGRYSYRMQRECRHCHSDTRPEFNRLDIIKQKIINESVCPGCSFKDEVSDGTEDRDFHGMTCATCHFRMTEFAKAVEETCESGCKCEPRYTDACYACKKNPIRQYSFMTYFGYEPPTMCTYYGPSGPLKPFLRFEPPPIPPVPIEPINSSGAVPDWTCTNCGNSGISRKFCDECGSPRP